MQKGAINTDTEQFAFEYLNTLSQRLNKICSQKIYYEPIDFDYHS